MSEHRRGGDLGDVTMGPQAREDLQRCTNETPPWGSVRIQAAREVRPLSNAVRQCVSLKSDRRGHLHVHCVPSEPHTIPSAYSCWEPPAGDSVHPSLLLAAGYDQAPRGEPAWCSAAGQSVPYRRISCSERGQRRVQTGLITHGILCGAFPASIRRHVRAKMSHVLLSVGSPHPVPSSYMASLGFAVSNWF